ncbi:hypothetical protein HCA61_24215 [Rhodococcus sp. HNM0563]|uniref:hypothetical protein n=1 Tax=unclassified Rhodococcus (in: high G+C Gram-positive bacteria) TaxID=192944 RepID=UPI00146D7D99|nr:MULTISPECIES: hypothetical protein [unclassified Rhodococcus (in: high G+C Gram-positive bacteria)]MCK0093623.1 hypothetical protein [Rhodococcus sp. F64268]NLU65338.1 hypothetical protein [Rhodococcus sp. HNM0563]
MTYRRILGYATVAAAVVPLVLAGTGVATAMGGNDPRDVYLTSDFNSITAHIGQDQGITDCKLVAQGPASSDIHETDWTSNESITLWLPQNRYTATVLCKWDMTGPDGWIVRQEAVNTPPLLHESAIDLIERGFA